MENIYHRFIDIPFEPGVDLSSKSVAPSFTGATFSHTSIDPSEINPLLLKWLNDRGVTCLFYEAFCSFPNGGNVAIHTDESFLSQATKINWVYGAPTSKMIWWQVTDPEFIVSVKSSLDAHVLTCDEKYCQKIYEKEIDKPSLVNVGIFHSSFNPTAEKRWCVSLPLFWLKDNQRLEWNDALILFKDCIIDSEKT